MTFNVLEFGTKFAMHESQEILPNQVIIAYTILEDNGLRDPAIIAVTADEDYLIVCNN